MYQKCLQVLQNKTFYNFNFNYIYNPQIIFLINSIPNDFQTRCGIRSSWSHLSQRFNNLNISYNVIFQIGKRNNYNISNLHFENNIFHDLFIHGNIIDTYKSLTQKNIASWIYIKNNYPETKMIVKSDSDVFINMKIYLKHLLNILNSNIYYEGYKYVNAIVIRNIYDKNFESYKLYADNVFPPYCSGRGYVFKTSVLNCLLKNSNSYPYLNNEDVYTGLLMNICNIEPIYHPGYSKYGIVNKDIKLPLQYVDYFKTVFFIHGIKKFQHIKLDQTFNNNTY